MKGTWWRSEWFSGALVVIAFALTLRYEPLAGIEGWLYDAACRLSAPVTFDDGVVIVAVDEIAREDGGERWSREKARRLLDLIKQGTPRGVALFWPLDQASPSPALSALGHEAEALLRQQTSNEVSSLLQKIAAFAESDERLAQTMRSVDHLILVSAMPPKNKMEWQWSQRELLKPLPPQIDTAPAIDPLFSTASYAVANGMAGDASVVMRRIPLRYRQADGTLSPMLPLQLWALRQQVDPLSIRVTETDSILVGGKKIATDAGGYFLPRWNRGSPRVINASELMSNSRLSDMLHDRVVLAGPLTPTLTAMSVLPDGRVVAPVEAVTMILTALATNEMVRIPEYARWAQLGSLLLVALLLTLLLPRLSTSVIMVTGLVLLAIFINVQLLTLLLRGEWLPLATPMLALAAGFVLLMARRRVLRHLDRLHERLGRVTVALAQQLRQQGQFDEALYHLQQCPVGAASEELYQLGLDYERKRQFNKAEQVFAYIGHGKPRFKDVEERARSNREASARIIIAGHPSNNMAATLVLDQAALQKPVVGRYQIERELGRGAMGMVYLGHDPKIGRTVAIKTVTLAQEYDDTQLAQVRERFFREAESAGRLSHSNIVTIYDVGEEGDLAYIAMDYLPGVSLDHHTRKEDLLPVEEAMKILMQVASALDYAHGKGVIHRDIKPANIIYDRSRGKATVTDFGVAHLADASKTRTGTILGSPYYMAPEQLAGAKVDGRADLFSLGVTFYQLLTGAMPFEADSIATLMYKIANSRHVSVSKLRNGIPICASRIVNQLLQKEVDNRYQNGRDLYKALQRCLG